MNDFFRFPHTPHVAWLGDGSPRDDKVLAAFEVEAFLAHGVILEEKVDGANLGFSVGSDGEVEERETGGDLCPDRSPASLLRLNERLANV